MGQIQRFLREEGFCSHCVQSCGKCSISNYVYQGTNPEKISVYSRNKTDSGGASVSFVQLHGRDAFLSREMKIGQMSTPT